MTVSELSTPSLVRGNEVSWTLVAGSMAQRRQPAKTMRWVFSADDRTGNGFGLSRTQFLPVISVYVAGNGQSIGTS